MTTVPKARSTVLASLQRSKTRPQSPEYVPKFWSLFREARRQQWPHGATLQQQLWGNMEDLLKNTTFIQTTLTESRRDQEEGGELDPHEEVSPEEIRSREVVLGKRERVGLFLLLLFAIGGATDIVFVILFCIAVGTAIAAWCCGRCAMPDGHCRNILLFRRRSTAALVVFRVGASFEVSLFCPPFPTRPRP